MVLRLSALLLPLSLILFAADEQSWKNKQIPDWTEGDAKQVLSDSPWVKVVTPTLAQAQPQQPRRFGGPGMGRRGGYGYPGGGYPGGGYPGGGVGYPGGGGGYPGGSRREDDSNAQLPKLNLRWESALPIREAELKTRDNNAPTVDSDHYAIAVYGVPSRFTTGDQQKLADQFKKEATLKRDGKKDLKPSSVEILQRDDGPVVVYLFPRTKEITAEDRRVEFEAKMGRLEVSESFFTEDMNYQGKLQL